MDKLKMNQISEDQLSDLKSQLENHNTFGFSGTLLKNTCQLHKGARLDYVSVDSDQNFVFKCMYCVTDDNMNPLTLIPTEQILSADSKTVFANFPLKDRDLTREIKQIILSPPTVASIKQSIDSFFKEIRTKLIDRINSIHEKMVEKALSISDFGEVLISQYNRVSSKEHLKSIISDQSKSIENKSSELKEICAQALSKDEENKQLFTSLINSMKTLEIATDFETPKLISEQILKQLDSINIFLVEDMARLQQQLLHSTTAAHEHSSHSNQNNNSKPIDNLMKLVRNKFNDVSADSCSQLENQLHQLSFFVNSLSIPVPGPLYENLHKFNEDQTNIISKFINDFAEQNNSQSEDDIFSGQMEEDNSLSNQIVKLCAEKVIELVGNSTNFCSVEFIEDFSKAIKMIGGLLGLFQVRKSHNKSEERNSFNQLNQKQLENFAKLAAQVNLLTSTYKDQYTLTEYPQIRMQPNSNCIMNLIGNHIMFNQSGSVEEKTQLKRDLENILVQFPIAELLFPSRFLIPLPITFTRTKYEQSSEMGITMNGNELELTFPNCSGKKGQVVSEILKNQSGYLLRLKFNRPYGKHGSNEGGNFRVRLIPNSQIDNPQIISAYTIQSGFCSFYKHGATIVTRGSRLSTEQVRSEIREVEFRWCIARRQFFISDSSYSNINQVEEKHFDPTEVYRLGVGFYHIPEPDWKITFSDFKEIDPEEVSRF